MDTRIIARVNNVDIVSTSDEQKLVPIKPICDALGIAWEAQRIKIQEHYLLSSTAMLSMVVAADGRQREMFCLPMGYVFGWLLTINPANVAESSREGLMKYQTECYKVLHDYFMARALFVEQKQQEIDRQLTVVDEAKDNYRNAKTVLSEAEAKLKQLRSLTMDDYDIERRQLKLDFK